MKLAWECGRRRPRIRAQAARLRVPRPATASSPTTSAAFPPPGHARSTEVDLGTTLDGRPAHGHASPSRCSPRRRRDRCAARPRRRSTRSTTWSRAASRSSTTASTPAGLTPGGAAATTSSTGPSARCATPGAAARQAAASSTSALPAVYHAATRSRAPAARTLEAIPEARRGHGQLRRFVDLFGAGFDHLRAAADGLRDLHDIDEVDHRRLPLLAALGRLGADRRRRSRSSATRSATPRQLYRITGTIPGCRLWVQAPDGLGRARSRSSARNVMRSQRPRQPGRSERPRARARSTRATPALLARRRDRR